MYSLLKQLLFFIILFSLFSCSHLKSSKEDIYIPSSANDAFNLGNKHLLEKNYKEAYNAFSLVYLLDPRFEKLEQAYLFSIYSSFMAGIYKETLEQIEEMLVLYPRSDKLEVVEYLRALSYYMQINPIHLDQNNVLLAEKHFNNFVRDYPKSDFIKFIIPKIKILKEKIVAKEIEIGLYYLKRKSPLAAFKRFESVYDLGYKTDLYPELLYHIMCSLLDLGLNKEVKKYFLLLKNDFSSSIWYNKALDLLKSIKI